MAATFKWPHAPLHRWLVDSSKILATQPRGPIRNGCKMGIHDIITAYIMDNIYIHIYMYIYIYHTHDKSQTFPNKLSSKSSASGHLFIDIFAGDLFMWWSVLVQTIWILLFVCVRHVYLHDCCWLWMIMAFSAYIWVKNQSIAIPWFMVRPTVMVNPPMSDRPHFIPWLEKW